jgi:hypothetical protein
MADKYLSEMLERRICQHGSKSFCKGMGALFTGKIVLPYLAGIMPLKCHGLSKCPLRLSSSFYLDTALVKQPFHHNFVSYIGCPLGKRRSKPTYSNIPSHLGVISLHKLKN